MSKPGLLLGITGHPLLYTRSPGLHRGFLRKRKLKGSYDVLPFDPAMGKSVFFKFLDGLRECGYRGLNVTIPHKEWAFEFVKRNGVLAPGFAGRCAGRVRAVNTLVFRGGKILGANTDSAGFWDDLQGWLERKLERESECRLVVVGTGGSARGVIAGALEKHLFARRFKEVSVVGRDKRKVAALQKLLPASLRAPKPKERVTVVAWCLPPLGPSAARAIFRDAIIGRESSRIFIYDLNYGDRAADTEELVAKSCRRTGMGMLRGQAAAAFALWAR